MTTLSNEQDRMLDLLLSRTNGLSFGGYAGTGKTTVLAEAARMDPSIIFAAPTNKAASVLRSKMPAGSDVRTFHALTQKPVLDDKSRLTGFEEVGALPKGTHVIVDEASMIGTKVMSIAQSALANATVNLVGDPAQLPPVNDLPVFRGSSLTMILKEVYRQGEGSRVLELATRIREQSAFHDHWLDELGIERETAVKLKKNTDRMAEIWDGDAQFLCFTNQQRRNMNKAVRTGVGRRTAAPDVDDVIMFYARELCLGEPRWNNGSTALITSINESLNGAHNVEVEIDGGSWAEEITLYDGILDAEQPSAAIYELPDHLRASFACASYAYALTVHKSQGSEWDKVYLQGNRRPQGSDGIRWLYTGITRAAKELVWVE
jgi:exodeoxyribonuclease-5